MNVALIVEVLGAPAATISTDTFLSEAVGSAPSFFRLKNRIPKASTPTRAPPGHCARCSSNSATSCSGTVFHSCPQPAGSNCQRLASSQSEEAVKAIQTVCIEVCQALQPHKYPRKAGRSSTASRRPSAS